MQAGSRGQLCGDRGDPQRCGGRSGGCGLWHDGRGTVGGERVEGDYAGNRIKADNKREKDTGKKELPVIE